MIGPPGSYPVYVLHDRTPASPGGRHAIAYDKAQLDQIVRHVVLLNGYEMIEPVSRMRTGDVPDDWR